MTTRAEVYAALDTERAYQDALWTPETTISGGLHTVTEWLVYMDSYLREAFDQVSRGPDPAATLAALNTVRKITAMGVACMEQNGAPVRKS
ncbi:hypothetical protein [Sphingopyxis flava]|uniref:Uncharacterized protein n=1 Tax=Sphingopyxis flava TaxID=1507287 RepID=A0A1T5BQB6_9SPHN|nr:hypothetical protein [Sphingopyxis flava]SKB49542.1 hypothetical protein SAMN06295937_100761 [Sphingopyxis flava]